MTKIGLIAVAAVLLFSATALLLVKTSNTGLRSGQNCVGIESYPGPLPYQNYYAVENTCLKNQIITFTTSYASAPFVSGCLAPGEEAKTEIIKTYDTKTYSSVPC